MSAGDSKKHETSLTLGCQVLYRFDDNCLADFKTGTLKPHELKVVASTRYGDWVQLYGRRRWVNRNAHKRFAYPTKAEAAVSYARRKLRHRNITLARLDHIYDKMDDAQQALAVYAPDAKATKRFIDTALARRDRP